MTMIEFWLVAISALVTGACAIYIIYLLVWFITRPFVQQDRQIDKLEREQREMDEKLRDVSLELIGLKVRAKGLTERMAGLEKQHRQVYERVSELEREMRQVQWNSNRVKEDRSFLDKEIAVLRARIDRDNGAG